MRTDMGGFRIIGHVIPGWSEGLDPESRDSGFDATHRPGMTGPASSLLIPEIRFDRAVHLDRQRIAVAVLGIPRSDADPALADAVFLDIGLLGALETDADVTRKQLFIVVGTARIGRQPVGELVAHRFALLVHNRASISLARLSGRTVGACRPT